MRIFKVDSVIRRRCVEEFSIFLFNGKCNIVKSEKVIAYTCYMYFIFTILLYIFVFQSKLSIISMNHSVREQNEPIFNPSNKIAEIKEREFNGITIFE